MSAALGVILVAVGGGVGAAARFMMADAIRARRPSGFPWGTWWVNVLGSFAVGVIAGALLFAGGDVEKWRLLLATGLCGGFTTFSTTSVETVTLLRGGRVRSAVLNTLSTAGVTIAAVAIGVAITALLLPA